MLKQKYNPTRIQLLYQMLVNNQQQGHPREYDIKVDELKVVQRTINAGQRVAVITKMQNWQMQILKLFSVSIPSNHT